MSLSVEETAWNSTYLYIALGTPGWGQILDFASKRNSRMSFWFCFWRESLTCSSGWSGTLHVDCFGTHWNLPPSCVLGLNVRPITLSPSGWFLLCCYNFETGSSCSPSRLAEHELRTDPHAGIQVCILIESDKSVKAPRHRGFIDS